MTTEIKRILSGITTTGRPHLGNYLGAIKNWSSLQHQAETYLFVADLHAITTDQDPKQLKQNIYNALITYLACGIDPNKATIFIQSHVRQHAELAWILSCVARLGWLNRMTQFKDKTGKNKENAYIGLYTYPILQAADILLYQPTHVPVGADQKQHIELCRDIALAFNRKYENDVFTIPEPLIMGESTRVMSLRDATKKMSKSDESDYSRINLDDDIDTIRTKIQKAKSDSELISLDNLEQRHELNNLAIIYAACNNQTKTQVIEQFSGKGFAELKKALIEALSSELGPISARIAELRNNLDYIENLAKKSAEIASLQAEKTLKQVKENIGFLL